MVMPIDEALRAERIWLKILRKPSSVVITGRAKVIQKDGSSSGGGPLSAQTVRVAYDNRPTIAEGQAGVAPILQAVVYGVKGHPDPAIADTDIQEGDEFEHEENRFRVTDIIPVPGGVQAVCKAIG